MSLEGKEVIGRMSKIRRVLVGTLAAGVVVIGGLGVGNAWARSNSTTSHRTSSNASHTRSDDCPNHDSGGSNGSSGTASLSL
jgi:hypothetical protein